MHISDDKWNFNRIMNDVIACISKCPGIYKSIKNIHENKKEKKQQQQRFDKSAKVADFMSCWFSILLFMHSYYFIQFQQLAQYNYNFMSEWVTIFTNKEKKKLITDFHNNNNSNNKSNISNLGANTRRKSKRSLAYFSFVRLSHSCWFQLKIQTSWIQKEMTQMKFVVIFFRFTFHSHFLYACYKLYRILVVNKNMVFRYNQNNNERTWSEFILQSCLVICITYTQIHFP